MHWKLKSAIQNTLSFLPSSASYAAYYQVQRRFGGLRQVNPTINLRAGVETWQQIIEQNYDPVNKVFFEVGTGRATIMPLAYWLMGAKRVVTVDANPYVREELIAEHIKYMVTRQSEIKAIFGSLLDRQRFAELLDFSKKKFSLNKFFNLCQIEYLAPADASATNLPAKSIDFHTSFTVFEHIPAEVLKQILQEGNRIISDNGLFVHRIDYSDHFSHSDPNISAINFLQYSDEEWSKYAGNRYMYMNRLRHDDFIDLFKSVEHLIIKSKTYISHRSQELLQNKAIALDPKFEAKPKEVLSIASSWIISQKNKPNF